MTIKEWRVSPALFSVSDINVGPECLTGIEPESHSRWMAGTNFTTFGTLQWAADVVTCLPRRSNSPDVSICVTVNDRGLGTQPPTPPTAPGQTSLLRTAAFDHKHLFDRQCAGCVDVRYDSVARFRHVLSAMLPRKLHRRIDRASDRKRQIDAADGVDNRCKNQARTSAWQTRNQESHLLVRASQLQ